MKDLIRKYLVTESKGTFIDVFGKMIEVTDFDAAYNQAYGHVRMHEQAKKDAPLHDSVIYFEDAHNYWKEVLQKLEKLKIQNNY